MPAGIQKTDPRSKTADLTSTQVSMGCSGVLGDTQEETEDRDSLQNRNKRRPDPCDAARI